MFDETKGAQIAGHLLYRAGAAGLSRRRLLGLMYLAERSYIKHRGASMARDEFILTTDGPAMRTARTRIMRGPEGVPAPPAREPEEGTHQWYEKRGAREWACQIKWPRARNGSAVVAEAYAAYAAATPATDGAALVSRNLAGYRIVPHSGWLSNSNREMLDAAWDQYGGRSAHELQEIMLALPEAGGRTSGDLPLRTILEAIGFDAEKVQACLQFNAELESLDRLNARMAQEHGAPE